VIEDIEEIRYVEFVVKTIHEFKHPRLQIISVYMYNLISHLFAFNKVLNIIICAQIK